MESVQRSGLLTTPALAIAVPERSQKDYMAYSVPLLRVMGEAPVAAIKPHHISRYLTKERADAPVRANREISLLSTRFTFLVLRAWYATAHKSQYGELPEMHAKRATTETVYDRSKKAVRKSVD